MKCCIVYGIPTSSSSVSIADNILDIAFAVIISIFVLYKMRVQDAKTEMHRYLCYNYVYIGDALCEILSSCTCYMYI